ncbi:hypothetical protein GCM10020219_034020 [Nonomuraea dietziae]
MQARALDRPPLATSRVRYRPRTPAPMTSYGDSPASTPEPGSCEYVVAVLYLDDHLRITYTPRPSSAAVRLIGELDAANHRAAADTLRRAGRDDDPLVIDCEHLDFVDVAGLRMLIDLCRDGRARIANPPAQLLRLLHLVGLALP